MFYSSTGILFLICYIFIITTFAASYSRYTPDYRTTVGFAQLANTTISGNLKVII